MSVRRGRTAVYRLSTDLPVRGQRVFESTRPLVAAVLQLRAQRWEVIRVCYSDVAAWLLCDERARAGQDVRVVAMVEVPFR